MAEGTRDRLLSFTTNLVYPRLLPGRTLYVLANEGERHSTKASLDRIGFTAELLDYESLTTFPSRSLRGKSIVLSSPGMALERARVAGRVDGAILRVLTSRSRKQVIVTSETDGELHLHQLADVDDLSRRIAQFMVPKPSSDLWLDELLLELLYERHLYVTEIQRLAIRSAWWYTGIHERSSILETLRNLSTMGLVREERGRYYTSSRLGRLVVEEGRPIAQYDLAKLRERYVDEAEEAGPVPDYDFEGERQAYLEELVLDLIERDGWTTVNGVAHEAARKNVTKQPSRGIARRFLEKMVSEGEFVRSSYYRGHRGPMFVYYRRKSAEAAEIFENRCGDCAFYTKVARRCRLWWSLSRFNAPEVYERRDELSTVARDKFANANIKFGPNSTACDYLAPKKRDFPISKARETCLACGKEIEAPVAKLVRCPTCGTSYKPLATKILVSYNYERIFRDRYFGISGAHPPNRALLLPGQEYYGKTEWRDILVLYPHETIKFGTNEMYVKRTEGGGMFQQYDKIYEIVDYGALSSEAVSLLQEKGVRLIQRPLPESVGSSTKFYPSAEFVENLRFLKENSNLRQRMLESAMLSVIVATKRIIARGGESLQVLVNKQLVEYKRMIAENGREMSISRALGYEARVNKWYWTAYKTMLRVSGLDFQSRVRDRFVRELVESVRARSRGYSPTNAGINYLHQRRLAQCRVIDAQVGIGWIGCEGILHTGKRRPNIGLLLDLSDPFKLADRECFLNESLRFQISRGDFVARLGRHRLWFFYPSAEGVEKLENIGSHADQMQFDRPGYGELWLVEVYREYVISFMDTVQNKNLDSFQPFVYGTQEDLEWLASVTS